MWLGRLRFSIVVFVLLAFTGQSFAVVGFSCRVMNSDTKPLVVSSEMATHMGMDHSAHLQVQADDSAADTESCCDHKNCSLARCASGTAAIVAIHSSSSAQLSNVLTADYVVSYLNTETSSPFRPPISR